MPSRTLPRVRLIGVSAGKKLYFLARGTHHHHQKVQLSERETPKMTTCQWCADHEEHTIDDCPEAMAELACA